MAIDAGHWARGVVVEHPGRFAPAFLWLVRRVLDPAVRIFHRPTLEGAGNLPATGPYLIVANHSAGIALAEIHTIAALWVRELGADRPLAGFALPVGFRVFPLSRVLRGIGAIPSTYEAAARAFAAGVPVLAFPGGDHESLRPIWQANRVDFGGRVGFLRMARAAGVPVVPLGIRGSAMTAPIVARGRWIATLLVLPRLIGVKRWGISVLGVAGAVAIAAVVPFAWPARAVLVWLWLASILQFLPWIPWTLRLRVGAPIPASDLFAAAPGESDDVVLGRALARVQAAVQRLVDS